MSILAGSCRGASRVCSSKVLRLASSIIPRDTGLIETGQVALPCFEGLSTKPLEQGTRPGHSLAEMKKRVYLSLGANLGDREANLRAAIGALPGAGVEIGRISSLYETEPVDYLDQPWFLNCVVEGETKLGALELLHALREIETRMGSKKEFAKGPRLLDIDILLYGDATIATAELQVPHPRMLERKFVLAPLAEIAPELRHPTWNGTVQELEKTTSDRSQIRKY
jgi:2-amino-4-hydroxy-6-hydroxymethyldihydropteridine diphosphokinase